MTHMDTDFESQVQALVKDLHHTAEQLYALGMDTIAGSVFDAIATESVWNPWILGTMIIDADAREIGNIPMLESGSVE
jgi:hypothetical protein